MSCPGEANDQGGTLLARVGYGWKFWRDVDRNKTQNQSCVALTLVRSVENQLLVGARACPSPSYKQFYSVLSDYTEI